MLENAARWREENNLSELMEWDAPEEVKEDFIFKFTGYDDENRPMIPYGLWQVRRIIELGLKKEALRYVHRMLTLIERKLEKCGSKQFIVLLDSAGMTFWKVAHLETIETAIQLFRDFEAYYPETLKACYVVNNPWVFPYVYNFIKPLLSAKTLSKVQIFSQNENKWKNVLLKNIPASALPETYGGTAPPLKLMFQDTDSDTDSLSDSLESIQL